MKRNILFFYIIVCCLIASAQNNRNDQDKFSKTSRSTIYCRTSWQTEFESLLEDLTETYPNVEDISTEDLYDLGRAYIRSLLEEKLDIISKDKLDTESEVIVLKSMYDLFNYANPSGRDVSSVPDYDSSTSTNLVLSTRWEQLYTNALTDTVAVYDYGEQVYGDQLYEMGRCLLLSQFHNNEAPSTSISTSEWEVLKGALYVLCYLNIPGDFTTTYAPVLPPKTVKNRSRGQYWRRVRNYLIKNAGILGIGDGLINFLLGTPKDWEAFSARLSENKKWKEAALTLVTTANGLITEAAGSYTDQKNLDDEYDQTAIYANYLSGDDYATMLPPAVRIHIIKNLSSTLSSTTIADNMEAFIEYGQTYGLEGWQGIAQDYIDNSGKDENALTLNDFKDHLIMVNILLEDVDLGSRGENLLKDYMDDSGGEESLGGFFSDSSVYATF